MGTAYQSGARSIPGKRKPVKGKTSDWRVAQVVLEKLGLILATRAPLATSGDRVGSSELNLPQTGFHWTFGFYLDFRLRLWIRISLQAYATAGGCW